MSNCPTAAATLNPKSAEIWSDSASRTEPMIASNGAGYLAVFRVTDGGDNPIRKIYATRIDSNSGAYLDNPPLYLGMGKTPSVASNGTDYLVMWSTQAGHNQRLVRANGSLGPEKQYAILTSWESQRPIGLTFNGVYFAASGNGGLFTRIDPDGTFIDNPLKSGQGGGGEVVLADTTPTTDRRTFMVLQEAGVGALIDVGNFLVRSQTGSVISPTSMLLSGYNQPFGASDGTNFFVIARFGEGYNVKGLLVDPLTGAQLVGSSTLNLTLDTHEELRGASYDGKSFNVFSIAFPDNQEPRLLMRRFGPTLTPVADEPANGMLINDQAMRLDLGTTYAGFASDGNGCTLVAYTVLDVDRFGNSIKARFINDGATGPCGQGVVPGGTAGSGSGSGGRGSGGGASGGGSGSSNGAGAGGAHALGGNSGTSAGASGVGEGAAGSGKSGASHGGADSGGAQGADDAGAAGVGFGVAGTSELDAGASNAGGSRSDNGGGCGCRVTGTPAAHSWAILALGVGLLRRRRERRAAQCNAS